MQRTTSSFCRISPQTIRCGVRMEPLQVQSWACLSLSLMCHLCKVSLEFCALILVDNSHHRARGDRIIVGVPRMSEADTARCSTAGVFSWFMQERYAKEMKMFNVGEDCPVFTGQFRYCQVWPCTHLPQSFDTLLQSAHVTLPSALPSLQACFAL